MGCGTWNINEDKTEEKKNMNEKIKKGTGVSYFLLVKKYCEKILSVKIVELNQKTTLIKSEKRKEKRTKGKAQRRVKDAGEVKNLNDKKKKKKKKKKN